MADYSFTVDPTIVNYGNVEVDVTGSIATANVTFDTEFTDVATVSVSQGIIFETDDSVMFGGSKPVFSVTALTTTGCTLNAVIPLAGWIGTATLTYQAMGQ